MVKYRYASNQDDALIDANVLRGKTVSDNYYCLGCGNKMTARVNGQHQRPHFSHREKVECNGETYLHKLGKTVFVDTYTNCISTDSEFLIELSHEKICNKYQGIWQTECSVGHLSKRYDLTNYYQELRVEKKDGKFIPDVMLVSNSRSKDSIYIEIAVTHFLSEEKERSGNKIIQIPVNLESDVEVIRSALLTGESAMFIGFSQKSFSANDSDCQCAREKHYVFYVYKNGKSVIELVELETALSKIASKNDSFVYHNIIEVPDSHYNDRSLREKGAVISSIFQEQVNLANKRNIRIKNCYLCKYHGTSYKLGAGIYCKTYRKDCNSNEAATCDRYRTKT